MASLPTTLRTLLDCGVSLPSADTGSPTISSSASCEAKQEQQIYTFEMSRNLVQYSNISQNSRVFDNIPKLMIFGLNFYLLLSYVEQHQLQLLAPQLENLPGTTNPSSKLQATGTQARSKR